MDVKKQCEECRFLNDDHCIKLIPSYDESNCTFYEYSAINQSSFPSRPLGRHIAGYFIGFAKLYPLYRRVLYFLAITMPSLFYGLYDTFCGSYFGMLIVLPITFFAVFLPTSYLKQGQNYQQKLIK